MHFIICTISWKRMNIQEVKKEWYTRAHTHTYMQKHMYFFCGGLLCYCRTHDSMLFNRPIKRNAHIKCSIIYFYFINVIRMVCPVVSREVLKSKCPYQIATGHSNKLSRKAFLRVPLFYAYHIFFSLVMQKLDSCGRYVPTAPKCMRHE